MEKEMATQSSILTKEPGRLQFMGLQRVGHELTAKFLIKLAKQQVVILIWTFFLILGTMVSKRHQILIPDCVC